MLLGFDEDIGRVLDVNYCWLAHIACLETIPLSVWLREQSSSNVLWSIPISQMFFLLSIDCFVHKFKFTFSNTILTC